MAILSHRPRIRVRGSPPHELGWVLSESGWYGDILDGVKSPEMIFKSSQQALAISSEHGFIQWLLSRSMIGGWCVGALGQAAIGIPQILKGLDKVHSIGTKLFLPCWLTLLAETYGRAGQYAEGLDQIAEAIKTVENTQQRWAEAEIYRLRGTLLLSHTTAAAEESFCYAREVTRRQNARFWELRAATSLARDRGKRSEARDLLAPIYGGFIEGFGTLVLEDPKALPVRLDCRLC